MWGAYASDVEMLNFRDHFNIFNKNSFVLQVDCELQLRLLTGLCFSAIPVKIKPGHSLDNLKGY